MQNYSINSFQKRGYTIKEIKYHNFILSRIFSVSFLFLLFLFLHDSHNHLNMICLEFQFKHIFSRKLAELNAQENDERFEEVPGFNGDNSSNSTSFGSVSSAELMSLWNDMRLQKERKLNDTLSSLLDELNMRANFYGISDSKINDMWSFITKEAYIKVIQINQKIDDKLSIITTDGSCTFENKQKFIWEANFTWNHLIYCIERRFFRCFSNLNLMN
ncbi:Plasmodium exported protein, unknown function [Plasmodium gallinaceum]|uniref:Plasmodium RESA N-terminal domain-containing protein n=1 Tax=Plasmodium gallinaceum TaxID=5849 RepID=A0A1J1GQD6_PLAGA|nr:Plasmodium exported protein, unknown function [Plasmodium gallinaceum]CRG94481.1 Plasmodium exported protein, unknown function [Plasmodium gallinaceum]